MSESKKEREREKLKKKLLEPRDLKLIMRARLVGIRSFSLYKFIFEGLPKGTSKYRMMINIRKLNNDKEISCSNYLFIFIYFLVFLYMWFILN